MAWTLAPNLERRVTIVEACYPGTVVGEIGDQKHMAEKSDHNPDSRGIVHAEDFMCNAGTAEAKAILAWLLHDHEDLQYVIHNRIIYGRNEANGWNGSPYRGSDPHTGHIHASGKHGNTGKNAATGTGYDTAAEKYIPKATLCEEEDMPLTQKDADLIVATWDKFVKSDGNVPGTTIQAQPKGPRDPKNPSWSYMSMWSDPTNRLYQLQEFLVGGAFTALLAAKIPGATTEQIQEAISETFTEAFGSGTPTP